MISSVISKVLGTKNVRTLKKFQETIGRINQAEKDMKLDSLNLDDLKAKTEEFKLRIAGGASLDSVLPEAFAVCREVSFRVMGMRHYDVQLMGGIVLHRGNIAEMKTGEGKTLVATLPVYLNALSGQSVHVVTVNDYLAKRDSELMRPLYEALGLSVGALQNQMESEDRRFVYSHNDIIYGTNSEFAFDYLKDNMVARKEEVMQKGLHFALIDEVDSILIDEARTPLIISGQGDLDVETLSLVYQMALSMNIKIFPEEKKEHHDAPEDGVAAYLYEKGKVVRICEHGYEAFENFLIEKQVIESSREAYTSRFLSLINILSTTLKAIYLYQNHVDYLVTEGKVQIINAHTGRIEAGRRWSDGLHQSIEIKEGVEILPDNQAMASISLQNFYRMYEKIGGMTGTADTEAFEFMDIYGLDVVVIPPHKGLLRIDYDDQVFIKESAKHKAILNDIQLHHKKDRPILVGTASVKESELISRLLDEAGLKHSVLNAKNHEKEASIIAQAGRPGAITIATNMAGRGTDIILGGNAEEIIRGLDHYDAESATAIKRHCLEANKRVKEAGGLHVIGTTRHDSRRVDNQLKGRAGRQGDPGSSVFYVSFEDQLLKLFAKSGLIGLISNLGLDENEAITHRSINNAILKAQSGVESYHFNMRKELLKFDDINNLQRKEVYGMRNDWLYSENCLENGKEILHGGISVIIERYLPAGKFVEEWDVTGANDYFMHHLGMNIDINKMINEMHYFEWSEVHDKIHNELDRLVNELSESINKEHLAEISRSIMLYSIDTNWRDQIEDLEQLREGIHLRGFAQKNPVQEYGKESVNMFTFMIDAIREQFASEFIRTIHNMVHQKPSEIEANKAEIPTVNEKEDFSAKEVATNTLPVISHLFLRAA